MATSKKELAITDARWSGSLQEWMLIARNVLISAGISKPQANRLSVKIIAGITMSGGGSQIYCPKPDAFNRWVRNKKIFKEHREGTPIHLLATHYKLSERQITDIIDNEALSRQPQTKGLFSDD